MRFLCRIICFTLVISVVADGKLNGNVVLESESVEERAVTLSPAVASSLAASLHHLSSVFHHLNFTALKHLNLTTLGHLSPVTLHGNATNHWCCNTATTKKIVKSHSQLIYTKQIRDRVSHHHCGFLGTSRCARHHYYYISVPAYKRTYSTQTIHTSCPSQNLVCCKDYILIADNCVPLNEIPNIKDDLIKLHNANIPVGK
ncbi:uncharacterized protein LOC134277478 [Saccostrea cucullata]|uniref:uncharacterized protein LOC134277478 n=1 Tax=Saccostrea cuccullata TaxID=36930 RepID=UPI002ED1FF88